MQHGSQRNGAIRDNGMHPIRGRHHRISGVGDLPKTMLPKIGIRNRAPLRKIGMHHRVILPKIGMMHLGTRREGARGRGRVVERQKVPKM